VLVIIIIIIIHIIIIIIIVIMKTDKAPLTVAQRRRIQYNVNYGKKKQQQCIQHGP